MPIRCLGKPSLFLQLLIPSVVAVVLQTGLVQAWTLRIGAQAMDELAQHSLMASMSLLRAYLDPLGAEWSRVDGQLRLGMAAVAGRMDVVDRAAAAAGGVATLFNGDERAATGLAEVNTAVNAMDQVVQKNAAMAEQSTAACRTLLQEAEEMARLTGRFQMREDAPVEAVAVLRRPAPAAAAPVAKAALRVVSRAGGAARKPVPVADDG